jgi:hypothetical protein
LVSRPHLLEEGLIEADPAPTSSDAPEAGENQDGDDVEESLEESDSTTSPPPTNSKDKGLEKKRKRIEDLASSSTSIPKMHQRSLLLPGKPNFKCLSCSTRKFTLSSLSDRFFFDSSHRFDVE